MNKTIDYLLTLSEEQTFEMKNSHQLIEESKEESSSEGESLDNDDAFSEYEKEIKRKRHIKVDSNKENEPQRANDFMQNS